VTKDFEDVQRFFQDAIHASKGNKVLGNPDINERSCWNLLRDRLDEFDEFHPLAKKASLELRKQAAQIIPENYDYYGELQKSISRLEKK
jgi:hypothetical protein